MSKLSIVGPLHDGDGLIRRRLESGGLKILSEIAEHMPLLFSATQSESSRAIEQLLRGTKIRFIYEPSSATQEPNLNTRVRDNYLQCLSDPVSESKARLFIGIDRLVYAASEHPRDLIRMIKNLKRRTDKNDFKEGVFLAVNRGFAGVDVLTSQISEPWVDTPWGFKYPFGITREEALGAGSYPFVQSLPEAYLVRYYGEVFGNGKEIDMPSGAWVISQKAAEVIVESQSQSSLRFPEGEWPFIVKSAGGRVDGVGPFGKALDWEHKPLGWQERGQSGYFVQDYGIPGSSRIEPTLGWLGLFRKYPKLVGESLLDEIGRTMEYLAGVKEGKSWAEGLEQKTYRRI